MTYLELDRNLPVQLQTLKESVNKFARQILRPTDVLLDRLADPEEAIAPKSPLWNVLRAAYTQRFHIALIHFAVLAQIHGLPMRYCADSVFGQLHIVRTTRNCAFPLIMRA